MNKTCTGTAGIDNGYRFAYLRIKILRLLNFHENSQNTICRIQTLISLQQVRIIIILFSYSFVLL